jgi:hypothetical protein
MEISETTRRLIPKSEKTEPSHDRNSALTSPVAAAAYPHLHWKATEHSRAAMNGSPCINSLEMPVKWTSASEITIAEFPINHIAINYIPRFRYARDDLKLSHIVQFSHIHGEFSHRSKL